MCRSERQLTWDLAGPEALQRPTWMWTICLLSLPACGSQDLGSDISPMPIPFGRKDTFWHHHFYSQSFTTANLLMFYLFLFELVIKELTQFIQTPSSKSHYGVVAIVIFRSPNESNWILMTVDSIKQHLIGLLPRNFIFIAFSIMLPKITQQESYQGLLPSYMDSSLKSGSHFLLFLTSQIFLFHSFIPQDTLNTVSASIENGKISHL